MSGRRGCNGKTKRGRRYRKGGPSERFCAQEAIVFRGGKGYCYYHDPENPKKFGEPRVSYEERRRICAEDRAGGEHRD